MSVFTTQLEVTRDHPVPVEPLGGTAVVTVAPGDATVYYGQTSQVSVGQHDGTITAASPATFTSPAWIVSGGTSAVTIQVYTTYPAQTQGYSTNALYASGANVAPSDGDHWVINTLGSKRTVTLPAAAAGSTVTVTRENTNANHDPVVIQTPDATLINGSLSKISLGDPGETVRLVCYSNGSSLGWRTNEPAGFHNIRRYGALGDNGTTDDTAAIQFTLGLGSRTLIPPGYFGVTQLEAVGMAYIQGVGFVGVQSGDAVISPTTNSVLVPYSGQTSNTAMLHGSVNVAYVTVDNVALMGGALYSNGGANTAYAHQYSAGIYLDDNNSTAEHAGWNLRRCLIQGFTGHGVYVGWHREAVAIVDQTQVNFNGGYGVVFRASEGTVGSNSAVSSNNLGGVWISGAHCNIDGDANVFSNGQIWSSLSSAYVNPSFTTGTGVGIGYAISGISAGGVVTTSAHGLPVGMALEGLIYAPAGLAGTGMTFSTQITSVDTNTSYFGFTVLSSTTLQLTTAFAAGGQTPTNITTTGTYGAGTANFIPAIGAVTFGPVGSGFIGGGVSVDRNAGHGVFIGPAAWVSLTNFQFLSNSAVANAACNHIVNYSANPPKLTALKFLLAAGGFTNKPNWAVAHFGTNIYGVDDGAADVAYSGLASGVYSNLVNVPCKVIPGGLRPGNSTTPGGRIWSGTGVPSNLLGSSGDMYWRIDTPGSANQRLYVNNAGSWTGIL